MNPRMKALINSGLRPAKTSKLNPYAMRPTPHGEIRVSPRLSAMAKAGVAGPLSEIAENKAGYATGKVEARMTAADMVRRYRSTKTFSARLALLNARVTEFARGDQAIAYGVKNHWFTPTAAPGATANSIAGSAKFGMRTAADTIKAATTKDVYTANTRKEIAKHILRGRHESSPRFKYKA